MAIRKLSAAAVTLLPIDMVNDTRLSGEALGVASWLLSRPPNEPIDQDRLCQRFKFSKEHCSALIAQLTECGYIIDEEGRP